MTENSDEAVNPIQPGEATGGPESAEAEEKLTFEEAEKELEEIVRDLERGDASLDRTLELWERGERLYALCAARLDAAESRIEHLTRKLNPDSDAPPLEPADDC